MRAYFSERAGRSRPGALDDKLFATSFSHIYRKYDQQGYFQKAFGKVCVDDGYSPGDMGAPLEEEILVRFGPDRRNLVPTIENVGKATKDDLFDLIEYLFDHIAKPIESHEHQWNKCGIHVHKSIVREGQREWRSEWNLVLSRMEPPYRLSEGGVVELLPDSPGLRQLVDDRTIHGDVKNVDSRVDRACKLFFGRNTTNEDRLDALRELAAVLEFLRQQAKSILPREEERDLFNIANNFGIRHHNEKQKANYDREIFYPWIFHSFLAAIDLVARSRRSGHTK